MTLTSRRSRRLCAIYTCTTCRATTARKGGRIAGSSMAMSADPAHEPNTTIHHNCGKIGHYRTGFAVPGMASRKRDKPDGQKKTFHGITAANIIAWGCRKDTFRNICITTSTGYWLFCGTPEHPESPQQQRRVARDDYFGISRGKPYPGIAASSWMGFRVTGPSLLMSVNFIVLGD